MRKPIGGGAFAAFPTGDFMPRQGVGAGPFIEQLGETRLRSPLLASDTGDQFPDRLKRGLVGHCFLLSLRHYGPPCWPLRPPGGSSHLPPCRVVYGAKSCHRQQRKARKAEALVLSDVKNWSNSDTKTREMISEDVAEDHARLLTMIAECLAEVGITASLTTFHKLVLRADAYHAPARYEPELDVFRPDEERPGIALKVKIAERGGRTFVSWGVSWACTHPTDDPLGTIQVIADAVQAA
jgi:hypothetical protein